MAGPRTLLLLFCATCPAAAVPVPCSYAGREFSGSSGDFEDIKSLCPEDIGPAFSLAWTARADRLDREWMRAFDFGNGERQDNLLVAATGGTSMTCAMKGPDSVALSVAITQGETSRFMLVVSADGSAALYKDRLRAAQTGPGGFVAAALPRSKMYVSRSNWPSDDASLSGFWQGYVGEVTIWYESVDPLLAWPTSIVTNSGAPLMRSLSTGRATPDCVWEGRLFGNADDLLNHCPAFVGSMPGGISVAFTMQIDTQTFGWPRPFEVLIGAWKPAHLFFSSVRPVWTVKNAAGNDQGRIDGPNVLVIGVRYRFLLSLSATGRSRMYQDGTMVNELETGISVQGQTLSNLYIGAASYKGLMEDVYLFHDEVSWESATVALYPPDCVYSGRVFDGSSSEDITNLCSTDTFGGAVSVAFTFRVDMVDSNFPSVFSFSETANSNRLSFSVVTPTTGVDSSAVMWGIAAAPGTEDSLLSDSAITFGQTYRFLVSIASTGYMTMKYSDGASVVEKNSAVTINNVQRTLTIGGDGFKGLIEDVYIFHRKVDWANALVTSTTSTSETSTTTASTSTTSSVSMSTSSTTSSTSSISTTSSRTTTSSSTTDSTTTTSSTTDSTTTTSSTTDSTTATFSTTGSTSTTSSRTTSSTTSSTSESTSSTSSSSTSTSLTGTSTGSTTSSTSLTTTSTTTSQTTLTTSSSTTSVSSTESSSSSSSSSSTWTSTASTSSTTSSQTWTSTATTTTDTATVTTTGTDTTTAAPTRTSSTSSSTTTLFSSGTSSTSSSTRTSSTSSTTLSSSTTQSSSTTASSTRTTSSSSSSTSTATTSSRTTATVTTSTTSEVSEQEKVEELLGAVEEIEAELVSSLADSNDTVTTVASPVSVTAAAKLSDLISDLLAPSNPQAPGGSSGGNKSAAVPSVVVPVEGTDVEVAVPVTVFTAVAAEPGEEVVMVVTVFNASQFSSGPPSPSASPSQAPQRRVTAVISIDLLALSNGASRDLEVGGLSNAIEFSMPVNYTSGTQCAFWDDTTQSWSTDGVSVSPKSTLGGMLWCLTRHLSLFGAIWQAFVLTLGCSQVSLLTLGSIQAIIQGDWYQRVGSIVIWSLLGLFTLMYLYAAHLDRKALWSSEFFLMPKDITPEERQEEIENSRHLDFSRDVAEMSHFARGVAKGTRISVVSTTSDFGPAASVRSTHTAHSEQSGATVAVEASTKETSSCPCLTGCVAVFNYTLGNSAVRDAMREIMNHWCRQLGFLQGVCEGVWHIASFGPASLSTATVSSAKVVVTCRRALKSVALLSAQRQTGARMAISSEMVMFILEDPDIFRLLVKYSDRQPSSKPDVCADETGEESWHKMYQEVVSKVLEELERQQGRSVLAMTCKYFLVNNPFAAVLTFDPFYDRRLRTFLFVVDQALTIMVMCLFFEGSGERKQSFVGNCNNAALQLVSGYKIGRFMAIAMASALISTFPIFFLESLQTKGMKQVAYKGSEEWRKQLQVWRVQDRMIYGIGSLLFLGAIFFINLFLANCSAQDQKDWLLGVALVLLQDWIMLPFSVAIALPMTCKALLFFLRLFGKVDMAELVKEQRVALFEKTNAMLPVMQI